ncbi:MAG: type IV secretion system DNA-binding domain-containing protein [Campylobacterales bacterium]|nr:type IV secretion system DNA-binding domain-containing protein [Campylobacterales bacterium]
MLFSGIYFHQYSLWVMTFDKKLNKLIYGILPQTVFILGYYVIFQVFRDKDIYNPTQMLALLTVFTAAFYGLRIWLQIGLPDKAPLYDSGLGDIKTAGSMLNPRNLLSGQRWTTPQELQEFSAPPEKTVFIDEFTYYNTTKQALGLDLEKLHVNEGTRIKFKPLDFTKTVLMLGKMGSGKTEAIISIARQKQFNRIFANCVKDDLMQALYEDGDIIFSPYSTNSWTWDLWAEMDANEAVALAFFKNLLTSQTGKANDGDFWSNRAAQVLNEIALKVWQTNQTAAQKWHNLAAELKLKIDLMLKEGTTQASLASTMQIATDIIYLLAFRAQEPNARFFTLNDYFDGSRNLFMLNNQAYSSTLTPLYTGFTAAAVSILLGRPDTKTNLTLFLLDEYFSLAMDVETQTSFLTLSRSKGGCIILAAQMLPKDNKKVQQLVDSSRYALLAFALSDDETIKHICGQFSDIEYTKIEKSINGSTNSGSSGAFFKKSRSSGRSSGFNISVRENKKALITPEMLNSQMPKYCHLTIVPDDDLLYLGYTPAVDYRSTNIAFEKINTAKIYEYIKDLR